MNIRKVRKDDAERIRRILQVSFEDEYRRMGQKNIRLPSMTDRLLKFYLDRTPECSFVVEGKGGLVGFCLSCRWGTTAWMGPIAVLPPVQGKGYGRSMVEASSAELRKEGATTIGIETMPRSYRNLHFYSSMGMRFEQLTLDLSQHIRNRSKSSSKTVKVDEVELHSLKEMTPDDGTAALDVITTISGNISTGLDYRLEVEATSSTGMGETVLAYYRDFPVGFAVLHTEPYAREEISGTVRINTLSVVPPDKGEAETDYLLNAMVDSIEQWILRKKHDSLIFRVPVKYSSACDLFLRRGYSITHSDIRMTYRDAPEVDRPGLIHLNKWE